MSTNYYVRGYRNSDDPETHIGKASAAGRYCYSCKTALCKDGEERIHYAASKWHDKCPKCSGDGEYVTSFSWAMHPDLWEQAAVEKTKRCPCYNRPYEDLENCIEDEYGNLYSKETFKKRIEHCPIQYTCSIGQYFS